MAYTKCANCKYKEQSGERFYCGNGDKQGWMNEDDLWTNGCDPDAEE